MSHTGNVNPSDRGSVQHDKLNAPTRTAIGHTRKAGRHSPADKNATYHQLLNGIRDDVRAIAVARKEFMQELVEESKELRSSMREMRGDVEESAQNTKDVFGEISDTLSRIEDNMAQTRLEAKETLRELQLYRKDMERNNSRKAEDFTAIVCEVTRQMTLQDIAAIQAQEEGKGRV